MSGWRLVDRIADGELMPPFHGLAYLEWQSYTQITAVVPLNWIIAIARASWALLRYGTKRLSSDPRSAYLQGVRDGRAAANAEEP